MPTGKTPSLSKSELQRGVALSIDNAKRLLNSAESLVEVNLSHAFVFYTLAVEEYGKALWLKEFEKKAKPSKRYDVQEVFRQHETKLEKARISIPLSCKNIMRGLKLSVNSIQVPKTLWYDVKVDAEGFKRATRSVPISGGVTGKFFDVADDYTLDVNARLEALYVDCFYIGSGHDVQWSNEIVPTVDGFQKAIRDLRSHLSLANNS
jgi:AbiV family abortive infection protein